MSAVQELELGLLDLLTQLDLLGILGPLDLLGLLDLVGVGLAELAAGLAG